MYVHYNVYRCSGSYILRSLEPQHAKLLASHYPYSGANIVSWLEDLISKYPSVAAYSKSHPFNPVSWIMQYETGEIGNSYTLKMHRKKGLSLACLTSLFQSIADSGQDDLCFYMTDVGFDSFFERFGMVNTDGYQVYYAEKLERQNSSDDLEKTSYMIA